MVGLEYMELDFVRGGEKSRYKCKSCNREWLKRPNKVRNGQGCASCHRHLPFPLKSLEKLKEEARKVNMEYLELFPVSGKEKVRYRCNKCGHESSKCPGDVAQGHGCIFCGKTSKKSLEMLRSEAENVGFEYMESRPARDKEKARYRCKACGYISLKMPSGIKQGNGCSKCSGSIPKTLDELRTEAKKIGLEYLENEPKGNGTHARYRCEVCGFEQLKDPSGVRQGKGCINCKTTKQEKMCHCFFEAIFKSKFDKHIHPAWLRLENGHYLHLDGYCKEIKVAFEYNGQQHYSMRFTFNNSAEDLEKQKIRDEIKVNRCKKQDVILIVVPYWIKHKQMQDFIINEYYRLSGNKIECDCINWKLFEIM